MDKRLRELNYKRWKHMIERCYDPNDRGYKNYGGRGIKVCDEWLGENGFNNFLNHVSQLEHFGEPGYSLDRTNNNGDYKPGNVRWATRTQQIRNRRNARTVEVNGEKMTFAELSERTGLTYDNLYQRDARHVSEERLIMKQDGRTIIFVDGKSLKEWSKITGINEHTLRTRYFHGDRGERLFRPEEKRRIIIEGKTIQEIAAEYNFREDLLYLRYYRGARTIAELTRPKRGK